MGATDTSAQQEVGRRVRVLYPWQIPLRGWFAIARRLGHEVFRDHVFIASAGVAFLALFALLPLLAALVSVYGLLSSPQQLSQQLQSLSSLAPDSLINGLRRALHGLVRDAGFRLIFHIVLSLLLALWVALRGVLGIISALNIVYGEKEKRSWLALLGTACALAVGALVFWALSLAVIIGAPWVLGQMALNSAWLHGLVLAARWLVIAVASLVSMTVLYRLGPSHTVAHWEWLSIGSFVGTALWLGASAGMSLYVSHTGQFGSIYGPLGLVMVVMTWFFLTAFVFLLGAEVNIETRRQGERGCANPSAPNP